MLKVVTIVGTRPELIKMSRVIAEFDQHTKHILVHTGQNFDFELNEIFFRDLNIRRPDYFLEAFGTTPAQTIARVIEKSDEVFDKEKPDALLVYGDTNSALCVIAAKRRKIPVFHMEAGNRCFDQRVPEELNRKVVDHLSDINLVLTEHARGYLIAEGIPAERIIKSGSHMKEVLTHAAPAIEKSTILSHLKLKSRGYFLVSAHREENIDAPDGLKDLAESLQALVTSYDVPIIVSTHPRTRQRLEQLGLKDLDQRIRFLKPFGFFDYIRLQKEAFCVLSDSGTLTEEASLLDLPAVMLRYAHERPEAMDQGTLIMAGLGREAILDAVRVLTEQRKVGRMASVPDYEVDNVSQKILRCVLSYTDYVNRTIWHKTMPEKTEPIIKELKVRRHS